MNSKLKNHANISLRVPLLQWLPEERFNELLNLLKLYPNLTDQLAFFSSSIHPVIPLETVIDRMRVLRERMIQARSVGFSTGINFLSTIGHCDEYIDDALKGNYTRLMDIDGRTALASFCPNSPEFRKYVELAYTAVAQAVPDFIWIDDDVRMAAHSPTSYDCFCKNCLNIFNLENHCNYNREELRSAFNHGNIQRRTELRKKWLKHNSDSLYNLLLFIKETVHSINNRIRLGLMTSEQFYDGYDFARFAEALSSSTSGYAMIRPGSGFYCDDVISGAITKAHGIGRQVSVFKPEIIDIQSEIENFPYQILKKTPHTVILENAAYIAAGCSGAAYDILPLSNETISEFEPLIKRLSVARPFFNLLASSFKGTKPEGVWAAWKKDMMAYEHPIEDEWPKNLKFFQDLTSRQQEIFEIGLPCAYSEEFASVSLLSGLSIDAFSDNEIDRMFSKGVYLDGAAALKLQKRNKRKLIGFKVDEPIERITAEVITDDLINDGLTGKRRDCGMFKTPCHYLYPVGYNARILARLADRLSEKLSDNIMGISENDLGGRISISGYLPWKDLQTGSKTVQLKRLFRWLSKESLPGYVESSHKANIWIRNTGNNQVAAALINSSHDVAHALSVLLKTRKNRARIIDMDLQEKIIEATGDDSPYMRFILPDIKPWSLVLILI